jgi:hypothetical protein
MKHAQHRLGNERANGADERHLAGVAVAQGTYFLVTGLWPILHIGSFEKVVGPKVDRWLVKTFGGLVAAVGATLVQGGIERSRLDASRTLGVGTALSIAMAEMVYVSKRRISAVYGVDVLAELGFVAGWLLGSSTCPPPSDDASE